MEYSFVFVGKLEMLILELSIFPKYYIETESVSLKFKVTNQVLFNIFAQFD